MKRLIVPAMAFALVCPSEEAINQAIQGLAPILERPSQPSDGPDSQAVLAKTDCSAMQMRSVPTQRSPHRVDPDKEHGQRL